MAFFSLLAKLGLDDTSFQIGAKRVESTAAAMAGKVGGAFKAQLAGLFGIGAVTAGFKQAIDYASQLNDQTARLGVGAKFFQEWAYGAKVAGSNMEELAGFLEKLSVSRTKALQGDEGPLKAFRQLGVTVDNLRHLSLEDLSRKVAKVFENGNPQMFIQSLKEIGGKGAGGLVSAFSEGMEQASVSANNLGLVMDNELIASLDEMGDRMDENALRMKVAFGQIANAGEKAFFKLQDKYEAFFQAVIQFKRGYENGGENETFLQKIQRGIDSSADAFETTEEDQKKERDATKAKREARLRNRSIMPNFDRFKSDKNEIQFKPINTDDLTRIGGLNFGSDVNRSIQQSIQQGNEILQRIKESTEKVVVNTEPLKAP